MEDRQEEDAAQLRAVNELRINMRRFRAPELHGVANVESVELTSNSLVDLPEELMELGAHLRSLRVSWNRLETLPASIRRMVLLRSLDLSYNKLAVLPDELGLLTSLTFANFSDNCLSQLPGSIKHLSNLQELHLQYNQFIALPAELPFLSKLSALSLTGNPLESNACALEGIKSLRLAHPTSNTGAHAQSKDTIPSVQSLTQEHVGYHRFAADSLRRQNFTVFQIGPSGGMQLTRSRRRGRVGRSLDAAAVRLQEPDDGAANAIFSGQEAVSGPVGYFDPSPQPIDGVASTARGSDQTVQNPNPSFPFRYFSRRQREVAISQSVGIPGTDSEYRQEASRQANRTSRRGGWLWKSWAGSRIVDRDMLTEKTISHEGIAGGVGCSCGRNVGGGGVRECCVGAGGHQEALMCPISRSMMRDPVVAADGHSYEREAITAWLRMSDLSPMTGLVLPSKALLPDRKSVV